MDIIAVTTPHRTVKNLFDFADVAIGTTIDGSLIKAGTSSATISCSTTASMKFFSFYLETEATSGDARGIYNRLYLSGANASGGGESLRSFTTVNNVACGTAHGAHMSLSFGTTGSLTGLGIAARATLHIPDSAAWTSGTIAAVQAEIWSDGDDSDTDGCTEVSFIRVVNGGNANGIADVDDDANLITINGGTIAAGNMVQADTTETKFSHKIRCKVGSTTLYLMACDS